MAAPALQRLATLALGAPGRQRSASVLALLGLAIYVVFAGLQHGEVLLGLIEPLPSHLLSAFTLGGGLLFYALVRSGFAGRVRLDPQLTITQAVYAVLMTASSYAITGAARGAVLTLTVLILVFGMFTLSVRQARALVGFAFVAIGTVMMWKASSDPLRYPWRVELVHLGFAAIVLTGIFVLSVRMGRMRERLQAQRAELTLQKAELESALERIRLLATQDELTGLANRRHMLSTPHGERTRLQRSGASVAVVLIDLDHFKRINDGHGHSAGDTVLKRFAQAGRATLRASDSLARWGGEEFLLMLPDTSAAQAALCVQRLREVLARMPFDDIAPGLNVTFSAGIAVCTAGRSLDATLEAADQTLYAAKDKGRNRTEIEAPGALQPA